GDRNPQLLAGVLVHECMIALRHRELAEHPIVEPVFRFVGAAEQAESAGRPHQAVRVGPFAPIGVAVVGAVLQHVRVGEQQERDLAHAVIDRCRRARGAGGPARWAVSAKSPPGPPGRGGVCCPKRGWGPRVRVSPAMTRPSISFLSMPVLSSRASSISPARTKTSRSLFSITLV